MECPGHRRRNIAPELPPSGLGFTWIYHDLPSSQRKKTLTNQVKLPKFSSKSTQVASRGRQPKSNLLAPPVQISLAKNHALPEAVSSWPFRDPRLGGLPEAVPRAQFSAQCRVGQGGKPRRADDNRPRRRLTGLSTGSIWRIGRRKGTNMSNTVWGSGNSKHLR